jgi:hypothetical protein
MKSRKPFKQGFFILEYFNRQLHIINRDKRGGFFMKKKIIKIAATLTISALIFIAGASVQVATGKIVNINNLSKIETLEQDFTDNSLPNLLNEIYLEAQYFNEIAPSLSYEIKKYYIEDDKDFENYSNTFHGFKEDLDKNHLKIVDDKLRGIIVTADLQYFLNNYKEDLSYDSKDYLSFRLYEEKNHLYNKNFDTIDMDEVVKRINLINERLRTDTMYFNEYKILKKYYIDVFTGESHDYYFDFSKNQLRPYAVKMYEKYSARKDEIGEISKEILENGPWQLSIN